MQGYFFSRPVAQERAKEIAEARFIAVPGVLDVSADIPELGNGTHG